MKPNTKLYLLAKNMPSESLILNIRASLIETSPNNYILKFKELEK